MGLGNLSDEQKNIVETSMKLYEKFKGDFNQQYLFINAIAGS